MAVVPHPVEKLSNSIQKLTIETPKTAGRNLQNICSMESSGDVASYPIIIDPCHANGVYKVSVEPVVYYTGNDYAAPHGYVYDYPHGEWADYPCRIGTDGGEIHNRVPPPENGSMLCHPAGLSYPGQPVYIPCTTPYAAAPLAMIDEGRQVYGPQVFQYSEPFHQQTLSTAQYFPTSVIVTEGTSGREFHPDNSCAMISYGNVVPIEARPTYPVIMLPPESSYIRGSVPFGVPNSTQDMQRTFNRSVPSPSLLDMSKNGHPIPVNLGTMHSLIPQPASSFARAPQRLMPTNKPVQVYVPIPQPPPNPVRVTPQKVGSVLPGRHYVPLHPQVPNVNTAQKAASLYVEYSVNGDGHMLTATNKSACHGRRMNSSRNGYDSDLHNEQNRGPRTANTRFRSSSPVTSRHLNVQSGNLEGIKGGSETFAQYNQRDFNTDYSDGKFFVIKSYSEDDVHKSIKYNIWTSTINGNKKLEAAYQDALTRAVGKKGGCPVFLLFSVNASGQFCGLAEMVGSIDFTKSVDYWQQGNWSGQFAVKWHIIKDIPNSQFRHIILKNNENKPVTNSRDTQEVEFEKGIAVLNIFKNYPLRSCLLDDFQFYDIRQKSMQEKRTVIEQWQEVLDQSINKQENHDKPLTDVRAEEDGENIAISKCSNGEGTVPDGTLSGKSDMLVKVQKEGNT